MVGITSEEESISAAEVLGAIRSEMEVVEVVRIESGGQEVQVVEVAEIMVSDTRGVAVAERAVVISGVVVEPAWHELVSEQLTKGARSAHSWINNGWNGLSNSMAGDITRSVMEHLQNGWIAFVESVAMAWEGLQASVMWMVEVVVSMTTAVIDQLAALAESVLGWVTESTSGAEGHEFTRRRMQETDVENSGAGTWDQAAVSGAGVTGQVQQEQQQEQEQKIVRMRPPKAESPPPPPEGKVQKYTFSPLAASDWLRPEVIESIFYLYRATGE